MKERTWGQELRCSVRQETLGQWVFFLLWEGKLARCEEGFKNSEPLHTSNPMRKWLKGQIIKLYVCKQKTTQNV